MTVITVVGFDPSKNNWGMVKGRIDLETEQLFVDHLAVTKPVLSTGKQTRQNSKDIEASQQLFDRALEWAKGAHAVFVEIPSGTQSASGMKAYGICMGVLGSMRASGIPFFEVTPTEVKVTATGDKNATKKDMIAWAMAQHPEASWPMQTKKGVTTPIESTAEHMADALAAIYAGVRTPDFQRMMPLLKSA